MRELGIYVHIPFCLKKCDYCDFVSFANKLDVAKDYINVLKNEIKNSKIDKDCNITSIYIGGGTPSAIDSKYIREIILEISKKAELKDVEITIEVNPGTVIKEKLEDYLEMGVNRLSIGLQTTSNILLKLIGRIHTYEDFLKTYKMAREVGFKNINVDLMIGLPTENLQDVEQDLERIKTLEPEHISVYSLILEEGTKMAEKVEKKELFLPSEEIERAMYWKVKRELEKVKYEHYEISNFAKPNYQSRHNSNCWEQKEYIGFGLSAHSYFDGKRYSNTEILSKYLYEDVECTKEIHEIQDKESQMKEYMLLGLRKIDGIKISSFKNKFILNPIYLYRNELQKLVTEELIEIDEDNIKLTNKGLDLANLVWQEFV